MAVLNPATASALLYLNGYADRVALYALRNVNAGDTLDIGASGAGQFQTVNRAVVITVTNSAVQIAASIAGTVVTIPAGASNDMGYLLAWGAST